MKVIVTTSWDDGHKLDLKLSELLKKYHIKGTFYISKNYLGTDRLSEQEIVLLSKDHEIGAHTLTHSDLTKLSIEKARDEINESKNWLELVIGENVRMFCYPSGRQSDAVVSEVQKAGFKGARTAERYLHVIFNDPFKMGTTMNVYPFPFRKKDKDRFFFRYLAQPLFQQFKGLRSFGVSPIRFTSWSSVSKAVFDHVLKNGGVFHIWGHSWEIEKYGMWGELEKVLEYISGKDECVYLNNAETLKVFKQ